MLNIKDKAVSSFINLLLILGMFLSINTYADLKNSPFDVVLPSAEEVNLPSREDFSDVYLNQSKLESDLELGSNEQKDEQELLIDFEDRQPLLSLDTQPNIELMDLDIQGMQSEALHNDSEIVNRSANRANNSYPGCADMALGQATRTGFTQAGQFRCRGVRITQKIKLEAVLVDIPKAANFDLYLFQVINGELKLKAHSTAGVGKTSERIVVMANPGVYVLAAKAQTYTAGSAAVMAWFGYTQFDQQELNDSYSQATQISGMTTITGTMDHARDMDYFLYNFANDQKEVGFKFKGSPHILEVYTGNGWAKANVENVYFLKAGTDNTALFRVRVNPKITLDPTKAYKLILSNIDLAQSVSAYASGDYYLRDHKGSYITVNFPYTVGYAVAKHSVDYSGMVVDKTGKFNVPFAKVIVYDWHTKKSYRRIANEKGRYVLDGVYLGNCPANAVIGKGESSEYSAGYSYTHFWKVVFAHSGMTAFVEGKPDEPYRDSVKYTRICSLDYIGNCYSYMHPVTKKRVNNCR